MYRITEIEGALLLHGPMRGGDMTMSKREIAERYIDCFCAGDIDGIAPLLATDLCFDGPFYRFRTAKDYLDSLRNDPPEECEYKIISVTENEDSVAVFYEYHKPGQVMQLAQLFKIDDQKIQEALLIFDGRNLV